jgi:hypothetical protein
MRHLAVGFCAITPLAIALGSFSFAAEPSLEPVRGVGCYAYGDEDTPAKAKKAALALAQEQAVKSYRVYVQSSSTVKNFQLEDDLIQSASAGMLQDVQIEKQEEKGREICVTLTAKLSPTKIEDLIQQRVKAKEIAQAAQASLLSAGSSFGVRVWVNKSDGKYTEGEPLIVSVQSDRDAYLKLDYYQADGTVVHLVPNIYGGNAFMKAGQTYTFGGQGGREAFTITGPFGAETIKAIASTQPFGAEFTATKNVEESRGYLQGLTRGLRGVRVEASGQGHAELAEAAAALTTVSKATADHSATLGTKGLQRGGGRSQ